MRRIYGRRRLIFRKLQRHFIVRGVYKFDTVALQSQQSRFPVCLRDLFFRAKHDLPNFNSISPAHGVPFRVRVDTCECIQYDIRVSNLFGD